MRPEGSDSELADSEPAPEGAPGRSDGRAGSGRPGGRSEEEAYGLDDLIAHEKGQYKLVLLLFLAAIVWAVVQRLRGEEATLPFAPDRQGPPPAEAPAEPPR